MSVTAFVGGKSQIQCNIQSVLSRLKQVYTEALCTDVKYCNSLMFSYIKINDVTIFTKQS